MIQSSSASPGHRERMRQRLLASQPGALSELELLEMLLFLSKPRQDTKPFAKELLRQFGSLARLIHVPQETLQHVQGMNETLLASLRLVQDVAYRLIKEEMMATPILQSWKGVLDYCRASMGHLTYEQVRAVYLTKKYQIIAEEVIDHGTVDRVPLFPREIVKRALFWSASEMILVHNHPSGEMHPSQSDITMTKQVEAALKTVGIGLMDHIIIGAAGHFSFKNHGLLGKF